MKKLLLSLAIVATTFASAFGQSNVEELDFYQSILGAEKKAMVAEFLQLEQNDPFWAIYDEYETERKALGKKRFALLEDYSKNYSSMDDAKTDELIKNALKQSKSLDKLIIKYYKKSKKTSGSKTAAQFYHIETYLLGAIRVAILESIPAIGEE